MNRKATKGSISVQAVRGRLRLRWRVGGKSYVLSLGYPDLPVYQRVAALKAGIIETDILYGHFDPSLAKYKDDNPQKDTQAKPQTASMRDLWARYFEYQRPHIAPSTIKNQYGQVTRYVDRLPTDDPHDAIQIRDWARQAMKDDAAHRFIEQLCACCNWATESGLLEQNSFIGLAKKSKCRNPNKKVKMMILILFHLKSVIASSKHFVSISTTVIMPTWLNSYSKLGVALID